MKPETIRIAKILGIAFSAAILAACASNGNSSDDRNSPISISGKGSSATGVNKYLWAASLETLDFMPIFTADPIGGLIITDWYAPAQNERLKANIYILDTALRADALRVSVFKQSRTADGWVDTPVNPATAREIENAILTRARQLRLNSIS
ncbi:DUF3576 domain-containing protein [Aquisalinus flavus]|uniref:DUF3576 domain-containing protein n=1 Tax=Aquisalinus flavus TaxID=1526572 RepID=A0A8J2V6L7_9PROT|nr:DUF3576 domain-containing protein [Aquisalinus flavus]MBD0425585.1 DUF3576 domain-containing protein [Aquisalinus flavus]UNE48793.1 DUF3576 domain-containing protein [Aquisalinus flavus]GGD14864.1 hypothetical protein GCM10011342_24580 [Aquisalinus flavus]